MQEIKINNKNKIWLSLILLALVTFGIYHNSLNAPFVFDDSSNIVENQDIKKLSNIKTML